MGLKKRHSIGVHIDDYEMEILTLQRKELKRKHGYSRNEVLKVILMKLLSDDEFIEFVQVKGGLKVKEIKSRKR